MQGHGIAVGQLALLQACHNKPRCVLAHLRQFLFDAIEIVDGVDIVVVVMRNQQLFRQPIYPRWIEGQRLGFVLTCECV